jgi:hypothetical protein
VGNLKVLSPHLLAFVNGILTLMVSWNIGVKGLKPEKGPRSTLHSASFTPAADAAEMQINENGETMREGGDAGPSEAVAAGSAWQEQ